MDAGLYTVQMTRYHSLNEKEIHIECSGKALERVNVTKVLRVYLDLHLDWKEQVTKLLSSCYGALAVVRKIRHLAPFKIRNQLVKVGLLQYDIQSPPRI